MNHKKKPFEYLNSLGLHTIKPGLGRISAILNAEGNPHLDINTVLVAGTNGKSSTATAISDILISAGFSTGLYTSPHLMQLEERIKIDSKAIPRTTLGELISRVRRASDIEKLRPSYFETLTAAAFVYFKNMKVDFAVLEVGMGGKWDATNVARPLISAITNVSIDHEQYLGKTEEKIAAEKAGIVKKGTPLVTAARGAALGVIEKMCREKESPVLRNGTEFFIEETEDSAFSYAGPLWKMKNIRVETKGIFHKQNVCIALACAEFLSGGGFEISRELAKSAVEQTRLAGRMEYIRNKPPLIIDGAHNPAAALCLAESLEKLHGEKRFVFVIAMSKDKDHRLFIKRIAKKCSRLIFTRANDRKSAKPEELIKFAPANTEAEIAETPESALRKALKNPLPCCVTGSLYLAGEVKELMCRQEFSIKA